MDVADAGVGGHAHGADGAVAKYDDAGIGRHVIAVYDLAGRC